MEPRKIAIMGLSVIVIVAMTTLVHLTFFAAKGARFTAADGAREEQSRIQGDMASVARDAELAAQIHELRQRLDMLDAK